VTHTPNRGRVAVLAEDLAAPNLLKWLRDGGYDSHLWDGVRPVHEYSHLVTYYGTHTETAEAVLPALPLLAPGAVWIQMGRTPMRVADELAAQAAQRGVRYVHAPYVHIRPSPDVEPPCVAFCWSDDVAAPLIQALATGHIRWAGPLERRIMPSPNDLAYLALLMDTDDELPEQEQS
jgi:hypothetical protein